jgi:hypothetical protein
MALDPGVASMVISADETSALIDARIEGSSAEVQAKAEALRPILADLRTAHPDSDPRSTPSSRMAT